MKIHTDASERVLKSITHRDHLPVLHIKPENHPDQLIRLHMLLQAVVPQKMVVYNPQNTRDVVSAGAIIVADSLNDNHDGFKQACWAVRRHTNSKEVIAFGGSGFVYDNICIMRGDGLRDVVIWRLGKAINILSGKTKSTGIVWHECTGMSLIADLLKKVQQEGGRIGGTKVKAVSVLSALTVSDQGCRRRSGLLDATGTKSFLEVLKRLDVPLLLVDDQMMGIYARPRIDGKPYDSKWPARSMFLPNFGSLWPCLMPQSAWDPIAKKNMDDLAVQIYRIQASVSQIHSDDVVKRIKDELNHTKSKPWEYWAKRVLETGEFTQQQCSTSRMMALSRIVSTADAPFEFYLDSFVGTLLDPGRTCKGLMALRAEIDFGTPKVRACMNDISPPTYILVSLDDNAILSNLSLCWSLLPQFLDMSRPPLDNSVTLAWRHLVPLLVARIEVIAQSNDYKKWDEQEQNLLRIVWGSLCTGSMSRMP